MSRRVAICFGCFLIAVSGWGAPPDGPAPANGATLRGTVLLRLHWDGATPLPAGVLMACRARVVPLAPGGKAQPAEGSVVVPGGGGQCAMEIPVAWQGSGTAVAVDYEMDAISGAGTMRRSGLQVVALPGTGQTLAVDARL